MKNSNRGLIAAVALLGVALASGAARADGNVNVSLAGRGVDEDFWSPTDQQGAVGVNIDFGKDSWPLNVALGFSGSVSSDDPERPRFGLGRFDRLPALPDIGLLDTEVESRIGELSAGILWRPRGERTVFPYVGGGLALVSAEREGRLGRLGISDDDRSAGLYVNGGVMWRVGKHFNVGLDGRFVTGTEIELFGREGDADYFQAGVLLGYGW